MPPRVIPVPGVKQTGHRAVAYLIWPEDNEVTAGATIAKLAKAGGNEKDKLWSRFDHWVDGNIYPKYFHGWDEPGFRHCFTFKWNKNADMQRMYGTLFNPRQKMPGFQVCMLFSHVVKVGKLTDPQQKKKAEELFAKGTVIAAVNSQYLDK